jgi:hypothetical protein
MPDNVKQETRAKLATRMTLVNTVFNQLVAAKAKSTTGVKIGLLVYAFWRVYHV